VGGGYWPEYNIYSQEPLDHPQRLNVNLEKYSSGRRVSKPLTGSKEGGEHEEETDFPLTPPQKSSGLVSEIRRA
jgi:hypothetical protein